MVNNEINRVNDNNSVGHLLAILYKYGNIYLDKRLTSLKIGQAQAKILLILYKNESLTQIELSQILRLDKGSVTRSIKKLEKFNYIERIKDEKDNRLYHIILTEKGKEVKPKICSIFLEWTDVLLKDFKKQERELLFDFLKRMIYQAENYIEKN